MDVNATTINALTKGLKKVFSETLNNIETEYKKVAMEVSTKSGTVSYAWLSDVPGMVEWTGRRTRKELALHKYEITVKKWANSVKIPLEFIRRDQLGLAKTRIQDLARIAVKHYDELVFPLLESNGDCYDGKKFFAENHVTHDRNTVSNLGTKALSQEALLKARTTMRKIKNSAGQPMNISPTILVVPPELEATALKILKSSHLANGASNITQNLTELLVSDYLTDTKAWYLFDTKRYTKPFVLQKLTPIKVTVMSKEDDEMVYEEDVMRFGASSEDNAGYGLWQLAYKSTGAS